MQYNYSPGGSIQAKTKLLVGNKNKCEGITSLPVHRPILTLPKNCETKLADRGLKTMNKMNITNPQSAPTKVWGA